jgi:protein Mpv17
MLAQCSTALVLFGAGDIIAQQAIEKQGRNHDVNFLIDFAGLTDIMPRLRQFIRTARLSFYGGE